MINVYQDPWFTFRFAEARRIPRFHLEGVRPGRRVSITKFVPETGARLGHLATATVGAGGWVDLPEPIIVQAGEGFIAEIDPTILETQRLILREFAMTDAEAFFGLVSDPDVTRYTGDGGKTLEEARQGIQQRLLADYRKHGFGRWATVAKGTGKVIGFAGLKYLDDVGEVDLGYRFFKEHWGKGLATEASLAVLGYGRDVLRLPKIIGIADVANKASIRVLEKVGFQFDCYRRYRDHDVAWYLLNIQA